MINSNAVGNARGVSILISNKLFCNVIKINKDNEGRVLAITVKIDELKVNIINVYSPNKDEPKFYADLVEFIDDSAENTIIIGDLNLALDSKLDRYNTIEKNVKSVEAVKNIMDEYTLVDIWRVRNETKREYSWSRNWADQHDQKASRIDYALVSRGLDTLIDNTMYLYGLQTDHRAIVISVTTSSSKRGPGYWKFNNTLLDDQQYVREMSRDLELTIQGCAQKASKQTWETVKKRIKTTTQKYCRKQNDEESLILANLSEIVQDLQTKFPLTKKDSDIYLNTIADIDEIKKKKIAGVMFRSKARWYEFGKKGTKFFYNLEKRRSNAKNCYCIINENGQEENDPKKVLDIQRKFYEDLYSHNPDVSFDLQNNTNIKVHMEENHNEQISVQELTNALGEMKNGKSPGYDGITLEFYRTFWHILKQPLHKAICEAYSDQILFESARFGILNLIPKPGKDARKLQNLRPITLLNVDYKIIEKVIAMRMMPLLHELIAKDQRGFLPGRSIYVNIRKLLDLIEFLENENEEGLVLSCDYQKCFDKVSFSALFGSLKYFGFSELIYNWTQILYKEFTVKVQNNGHLSEKINIEQGVHQGGPASSCYFLVIAEILAINIRNNKEIKGIPCKEIINVLDQFADDMDVFSENSQSSINAIMHELKVFENNSGFKISYDKTTMYRIGSLKYSSAKLYTQEDLNWSSDTIKVLGIDVYQNTSELINKNYDKILQKAKAVTSQWCNRTISLMGKVLIFNALIASLFVYKMITLPNMTNQIYAKTHQIMVDFIWKNKKPKIATKILQLPKKWGGLGLVNIRCREASLKATWSKLLKNSCDYAEFVYAIMEIKVKENIWRCNFSENHVKYLIKEGRSTFLV